jgi:hypothetical protein
MAGKAARHSRPAYKPALKSSMQAGINAAPARWKGAPPVQNRRSQVKLLCEISTTYSTCLPVSNDAFHFHYMLIQNETSKYEKKVFSL